MGAGMGGLLPAWGSLPCPPVPDLKVPGLGSGKLQSGRQLPLWTALCPERSHRPLTDRTRGSDDRSFGQDFHDACPHGGCTAAVGVQVAQELLDNQVGVLRLQEENMLGPTMAPKRQNSPSLGPETRVHRSMDPGGGAQALFIIFSSSFHKGNFQTLLSRLEC